MPLVIVQVIGIAIAAFISWYLYDVNSQEIKDRFNNESAYHSALVARKLELDIRTLELLGAMFESGKVSPAEFKKVSKKLRAGFQEVKALQWVPRITNRNRAATERARKKSFPGFEITQLIEMGRIGRAKTRKDYFPVFYLEPHLGNEISMGLDLSLDRIASEAMRVARDSASIVFSASTRLLQDNDDVKSYMLVKPVYKGLISNQRYRRRNLQGFVIGIYSYDELFNHSLMPVEKFEYRLLDRTDASRPIMVYNKSTTESAFEANEYLFMATLGNTLGRKLELSIVPSASYMDKHRNIIAQLLFFVLVIFIAAVTAYLNHIHKHTAGIEGRVKRRTSELNNARRELETQSRTDVLTGAANRRQFDISLQLAWKDAIRQQKPVTLIMIDVDYFKKYNDRYGHAEGDKCLQKVTNSLMGVCTRPNDLVARYGGEELAVILPGTDESALELAVKCCDSIQNLGITHENSDVAGVVTISCGVSTQRPKPGSESRFKIMVKTADSAMYEAKNQGRNRVVQYKPKQ